MRSPHLWILAASGALLVTGCSPSFDAEEKNNKKEITAGHDDVTLRLAAASEAGNDLAGAERFYLQLSKNGSPASTMELAAFYTRHNQAPRAVDILSKAYANAPSDTNLMRSLANSLISADHPDKALSMLDDAIAAHNDNAYIYNSRGVALDRLGRYNEAQQSYRKAISLAPDDEADFTTNLSMSHILAGEYKNAIEILSPLLTTPKVTPAIRQNLALAYGLDGDMDKAMSIGSKDLTLKQMNENIRFYTLVSKRKPHLASASAPVEAFPTIAPPPAPVASDASAEDHPKETAAAPALTPPSAPTAEAVRNLSPATAATSPAAESGAVMKLVKPAAAKDKSSALLSTLSPSAGETASAPKPKATKPVDEGDASDDEAPQLITHLKQSSEAAALPMPILKPDRW